MIGSRKLGFLTSDIAVTEHLLIMRRFVRSTVFIALLCGGALPTSERAWAAGGAYVVDNADIGKSGECEVDGWTAFASNHDFNAIASPYCVVNLGVPVQVGALAQRSRDDGAWGTSASPNFKINLVPTTNHSFGLGVEAFSTWDLRSGAYTGSTVFVPITFKLSDAFTINVNGGWLYDGVNEISYATWGAGFEWVFAKPFTLIGEAFGQAGKLPAVSPGNAPSDNSIREPRTQLGIRYTPQDNVDIDVIWGHNIAGENAHWFTLGVNWRFSASDFRH